MEELGERSFIRQEPRFEGMDRNESEERDVRQRLLQAEELRLAIWSVRVEAKEDM
jgi:hypothetical protein